MFIMVACCKNRHKTKIKAGQLRWDKSHCRAFCISGKLPNSYLCQQVGSGNSSGSFVTGLILFSKQLE